MTEGCRTCRNAGGGEVCTIWSYRLKGDLPAQRGKTLRTWLCPRCLGSGNENEPARCDPEVERQAWRVWTEINQEAS